MKPITLTFQAFGAYLRPQVINFEQLTSSGLFLISGQTGSGKTVLLDAITYALYGKSSGGSRGDLSAMRCQLTGDDIPTHVSFVFEVHNRRYQFTRTLKMGRKHLNSSQNALYQDENGVFVPFFENPKLRDVEEKAQELLGLTYDQFRQVVILPQGQFERLLVANSEEKEGILVSLFGVERWHKAAELLCIRLQQQRRELDAEKAEIRRLLADKHCETPEELQQYIEETQQKLIALTAQDQELAVQLKESRKQLEKQTLIFDRFTSLELCEKQLAILERELPEIQQLSRRLDESRRARELEPLYNSYQQAVQEQECREIAVKKQEKSWVLQQQKAKEHHEILYTLQQQEQQRQQDAVRMETMRNMIQIYEALESCAMESKIAEQTLAHAVEVCQKTAKQTEALRERHSSALNRQAELYGQYSRMFDAYKQGVSGTLAGDLTPGTPCPVCGSTTHPHPAAHTDSTVTDRELEDIRKDIDDISTLINTIVQDLAQMEKEVKTKEDMVNHAKLEAERLQARRNQLACQTDSAFENTRQLNLAIDRLEEQLRNYQAALQTARQNADASKQAEQREALGLDFARQEAARSAQAAIETRKIFELRLRELGFDRLEDFIGCLMTAEEQSTADQRISQHKARLEAARQQQKELQEALISYSKPDLDALRQQVQQYEEHRRSLAGSLGVLSQTLDSCKALAQDLEKRTADCSRREAEWDENSLFAHRLRGDNGISLQRYILGVMLGAVLAEANRLLQTVHDGRYSLCRTLEASGKARKAGLELEVMDQFSGERRRVSTLSGGEKFLVSLALSISLSTVVQAESGGIALDTMFIDEGFGSLDPASIADALEVLSIMRGSGRAVGIISHVEALKEAIPAQIIVFKTREGSSVRIKE